MKKDKVKREIKCTVIVTSYCAFNREVEERIFASAPQHLDLLTLASVKPASVEQKEAFELELTYPCEITPEQVDVLEQRVSAWQHNLAKLYQDILTLKAAGLLEEIKQ